MDKGTPRTKLGRVMAAVVGAGALLQGGVALAADFRCADVKPSPSRQPAYQRAPAEPRCEGFFDRNVSHPFVELVSLTTTGAPSAQEGSLLRIGASRRWPAQLVVQPLRPAPFYRVDAALGPSQVVRWDAAPMLGATGLRLRDLGFLALLPERDGAMVVAPVVFDSAAGEARTPLQAVLRVSVPVAGLAWRATPVDGSTDAAAAWRSIPGPARFAWERIPLAVDMPADGRSLRVEVQATDPGGSVLPLLRFTVRGAADGG